MEVKSNKSPKYAVELTIACFVIQCNKRANCALRPQKTAERMNSWAKAAAIGKRPEVILRELDLELQRLREEGVFY